MPWHKEENHSECDESKPWAVVQDDSGEVMGCHETEESADEQLTALYSSENENKTKSTSHAIKLMHETDNHYLVGGYGHIWGDQAHKDLYDDYFTTESDLVPSLVSVKLVMFDHAMSYAPDGDWFDHPVGKAAEDQSFADDVGKWINAQLSKRAEYINEIMELIERGALAWSSGSVPHLVKRRPDGWLERWPVVEYSLTPTPAEPRMTNVSRMKAAYKAAGMPWLDALVETLEQKNADGPGKVKAETEKALGLAQAKLNLLKLQ